MSKTALKETIYVEQNGRCAITGLPLNPDGTLSDTDRIQPKKDGGIYLPENTRLVHPRAHLKRHGNLRTRERHLRDLKAAIDAREQIMKLRNKINNQIIAYERNVDHLDKETLAFLEADAERIETKLTEQSKVVTSTVKALAKNDPLAEAALGVRGVGPITVAYCRSYIDVTKATHASSLWSYTGLHKPSHKRYTKGETSGGNKKLRTVLYTMATSQVKSNGAYRNVYDRAKAKKAQSEAMVKTWNTQGNLVEKPWKDVKPSHRHGHALRMVMKHFLADYWLVARTLQGLETSPLYPEAVLKNGHRTIMPEERGWEY